MQHVLSESLFFGGDFGIKWGDTPVKQLLQRCYIFKQFGD